MINTEANLKNILSDLLKKIGFSSPTWNLLILNETLIQILFYVLINDHHCVINTLGNTQEGLDKTIFVQKNDLEAVLDRHLNLLTYDISLKILKEN